MVVLTGWSYSEVVVRRGYTVLTFGDDFIPYIYKHKRSSIVSSQSPEREREEEEEEDNEGERQAVVEGEGAVQNWDQEFDQPAW